MEMVKNPDLVHDLLVLLVMDVNLGMVVMGGKLDETQGLAATLVTLITGTADQRAERKILENLHSGE